LPVDWIDPATHCVLPQQLHFETSFMLYPPLGLFALTLPVQKLIKIDIGIVSPGLYQKHGDLFDTRPRIDQNGKTPFHGLIIFSGESSGL